MKLLYYIGVQAYALLIFAASIFNRKAKLWVKGRKEQEHLYSSSLPSGKRVWFHFASLGEFEQGRPVLEQIKKRFPDYSIVITFFSPSGYEIRKNYSLAEKVYYLPIDSPENSKSFIDHINPEIVFFTKYEYWFYYFRELHERRIPLFIISSIFRENQIYFKWYGKFYREILSYVSYFFVQDEKSENLLKSININNAEITGDTRFDRVFENSLQTKEYPEVKMFCGENRVFVAGSTWKEDEEKIIKLAKAIPDLKILLIPHEIHSENIDKLITVSNIKSFKYSEIKNTNDILSYQMLIIDTIGMLSSLYKLADICYVGGGFGKGIHNTLEAATFGKPIIFGPNYHKFNEAKNLIKIGAAFSINETESLISITHELLNDKNKLQQSSSSAREYVVNQKGATEKIITSLQEQKVFPLD